MELVAFIANSQDELEKLAYQTSAINYHRYFITVGFSVNREHRSLRETDSFLEIQSLDISNIEVLRRLILVYSPPDYENVALYTSNNIISLSELQNLFHNLLNAKLTKNDYLIIDEGFSSCDHKNINKIHIIFDVIRKYYKWCIVISHIDQIKNNFDKTYFIKKINNTYNDSKIDID